VDVLLATGCASSNGHAYLEGGRGVAWISASAYPSDETVRIFATHELLHAVHYAASPSFCFSTVEEKNHVGRQLIVEGMATYLTKEVLGVSDAEALWADYLSAEERDDVMRRYEEGMAESAASILVEWDVSGSEYFFANEPGDIDRYRSGYFIGLHVIRAIAERYAHAPSSLLLLSRERIEMLAKEELAAIANARR
jgi:uncharacterized protein YjaZ